MLGRDPEQTAPPRLSWGPLVSALDDEGIRISEAELIDLPSFSSSQSSYLRRWVLTMERRRKGARCKQPRECIEAWADAVPLRRGFMMDGSMRRLFPSRGSWIAPVSCAILAGGLVFLATPSLAAGGLPPLIGPVTFGGQSSGEGILEAQINPQGHETTYEIILNCPGQERCQHTEGTLPANDEEHAVSLELTGLQPGSSYRFGIYAHSTAGAAAWPGEDEFTVQPIPPGSAPNGVLDTESYTPPELPWANESGNEAAARTVAEQRAKELEEQQRKEATATKEQEEAKAREAALKHREDVAASAAQSGTQACTVPSLRGDTLSAARRALAKAHCRLGKVSKPKGHHHGQLVVTQQHIGAGGKLPSDTRIGVTLGGWLHRR